MSYYYTTVYTKTGNVWVAKCSPQGYYSWKLITDGDDFYSDNSPEYRYNTSSNPECSLGYLCSDKEFRQQIY